MNLEELGMPSLEETWQAIARRSSEELKSILQWELSERERLAAELASRNDNVERLNRYIAAAEERER